MNIYISSLRTLADFFLDKGAVQSSVIGLSESTSLEYSLSGRSRGQSRIWHSEAGHAVGVAGNDTHPGRRMLSSRSLLMTHQVSHGDEWTCGSLACFPYVGVWHVKWVQWRGGHVGIEGGQGSGVNNGASHLGDSLDLGTRFDRGVGESACFYPNFKTHSRPWPHRYHKSESLVPSIVTASIITTFDRPREAYEGS